MRSNQATWTSTILGHLAAEIFDGPFGSNLKSSDYVSEGARVVRLENIGHLHFVDEKRTYVTLKKYANLRKHSLHADDVLFSSFVDEEVRVCLFPRNVKEPTINKADCFCIRVDRTVCDPRWLAYALACRSSYEKLRDAVHGATRPRVNLSVLKSLHLDLPPLPEQLRIVATIDSLSSKSKRAREHLDHIPRLVEKYKQAVLAAAFRGELPLESHGHSVPPSKDALIALAQYCISITDGDHQAPPRAERGIPFITISAMNSGRIELAKATRFVPQAYREALKPMRKAQPGDVLYSVTGSIGIPALVQSSDPFVFQRHIALLRPDPNKCDSAWLWHILSAPQVFNQAEEVATGTAQLTVPLNGLRSFQLPNLDLDEQRRMVRALNSLFAWIDRLAAEATGARKLIDRLDQAVLAKAFRGELVSQNPNDEPASVLLEKIKKSRGSASGARPRRARKSI